MTTAILIREQWEDNTANTISRFMDSPSVVRRTRQPFPNNVDLCLRLGCTANIPTRNVLNRAPAIHLAADKARFRRMVRDQDTTLIPITWFDNDGPAALAEIARNFPVVVRPRNHQRGQEFVVCNNQAEFRAAIAAAPDGYYVSKFYQKRNEYRVLVIQGRVAVVIEKRPLNRNLPAWGRAAGWDRIRWGQWNLEVVKKACKAVAISGLDFAAADVIVDIHGDCYVTEVNSGPEMGEGECERIAWCMDYIIRNGKETIPLGEGQNQWRDFIHPAITDAQVNVGNGLAAAPRVAQPEAPRTIREALQFGLPEWL